LVKRYLSSTAGKPWLSANLVLQFCSAYKRIFSLFIKYAEYAGSQNRGRKFIPDNLHQFSNSPYRKTSKISDLSIDTYSFLFWKPDDDHLDFTCISLLLEKDKRKNKKKYRIPK
jgi:hypothetical protein